MPQVTDNMFHAVLVGLVFLILIGAFNVLFVGEQLSKSGQELSFTNILTGFGEVFSAYPELLILDIVLGSIFIVVGLFVARELLPV